MGERIGKGVLRANRQLDGDMRGAKKPLHIQYVGLGEEKLQAGRALWNGVSRCRWGAGYGCKQTSVQHNVLLFVAEMGARKTGSMNSTIVPCYLIWLISLIYANRLHNRRPRSVLHLRWADT